MRECHEAGTCAFRLLNGATDRITRRIMSKTAFAINMKRVVGFRGMTSGSAAGRMSPFSIASR